jgi:hypothetical protein
VSRLTIAVDRLVAFVLALVLLAAGVAGIAWGTRRVSGFAGSIDLGAVVDATDQTWWPWATGVVGAVLVLLGLRWLVAHLPRRGTGPLKLTGTGPAGRLLADGNSVADAAAEALHGASGVRSASGRVIRERGRVVARLKATIDADADLTAVSEAADQVSAELRQVLGRGDLDCRVELRLARRDRPRARVQ